MKNEKEEKKISSKFTGLIRYASTAYNKVGSKLLPLYNIFNCVYLFKASSTWFDNLFHRHFIVFLYTDDLINTYCSAVIYVILSINGHSVNMCHMFCSPNILLMCFFLANISLEYFLLMSLQSLSFERMRVCLPIIFVCVCVCNFSMSSLSSSGCAGSGLLASFKI